jgi:putative spermidine/putrescine transport system permease protein
MSQSALSTRPVLWACILPAMIFFAAFWILPVIRLIGLPYQNGPEAYFVILTNSRYLESLMNTLVLSLAVTIATLVLGCAVGIFMARHAFAGKKLLLSLFTLPLSFPGVVIGFFIITLGGRQGTFANLTDAIGLGKITFAYSVIGLFLGYLYFSLPRAITTYTAAAEALDRELEEAAKSLGASKYRIVGDVWLPQLMPATIACGAITFATAMGAFGTAFTLASKFEVLPITIYNEFTNYANFALAASLSLALGLLTWCVLFIARQMGPQHAL